MLTKKTRELFTVIICLWFVNTPAQEIILNVEEQAYLQKHPILKLCVDPDWLPYEKLDRQGQHIGLIAEYMALISARLNVTFEVVKTNSWEQTQSLYQKDACDIVSALNKTPAREKHLIFTGPYIKSPAVLVVNNNNHQVRHLADLKGKQLTMVKGYVYDEKLRAQYPAIHIVYEPNMSAALQKVASGEADATLGPLFLTFALIQELGLDNVKTLGDSEYQDELRMGINKENTVLADIFDKAVTSLSADDHAQMRKIWAQKRKQQD